MAWWHWSPSKDPDDYREDEPRPPESDDDEPEPKLHPRQHWTLIGVIVGAWVVAMALLGVHWWDFERHGPWLTPITPFAFAGALEGLLISRRPELNRHHDPDEPLRRRRKAHELGERARPYWARGEHDPALGDGGAPGVGHPTAIERPPAESTDQVRTDRNG